MNLTPQPSTHKYPSPELGIISDEEWERTAPLLYEKIALSERQPLTAVEEAQIKQAAARRKMQSLPNQQPRTELPNINWHDHYLQRVGRSADARATS